MERPRATLWLFLTILAASLSAIGFAGSRASKVIASIDRKAKSEDRRAVAPKTTHAANRSGETRRPGVLPLTPAEEGLFIPTFAYDRAYQSDAVGGHGLRGHAADDAIMTATFEAPFTHRRRSMAKPRPTSTPMADADRVDWWNFDVQDGSVAISWKDQRSPATIPTSEAVHSTAADATAATTPARPADLPAASDLAVQPSEPAIARQASAAGSASADESLACGQVACDYSRRQSAPQSPGCDTVETVSDPRYRPGEELALELNALNDGLARTAAEVREYVGREEAVEPWEAVGCEQFVGCDAYPGRPIVTAEPTDLTNAAIDGRSVDATANLRKQGVSRAVARPLLAAAAKLVGGMADSLTGLACQLESLAEQPVAPGHVAKATSETPAARVSAADPVADRNDDETVAR